MDETTWQTCAHPGQMLEVLHGQAGDRKLRLLLCACCRHVWHLSHERSRRAVEAAERFADGKLDEAALRAAYVEAVAVVVTAHDPFFYPGQVALAASVPLPVGWSKPGLCSAWMARAAALAQTPSLGPGWYELLRQGYDVFCDLLREVFGNPFRPLPTRSFPAHVVGLARVCYTAFPAIRAEFDVLADALEDIGEAEAAAHCRQEKHVRGCHVLDWVLECADSGQ
jgi:hypothetical protein